MNDKDLKELLAKYKEGTCTAEEKALLENWVSSVTYPEFQVSEKDLLEDLAAIRRRLPVVPVKERKLWSRIAAAASIVLALGVGFYFVSDRLSNNSSESVHQPEILPGGNKATLTLVDGTNIDLSNDKEGIIMGADELVYNDGSKIEGAGVSSAPESQAAKYLALTTPKGGQYQVVLPDGSKVWLNAASSLRYPASFASLDERRVELSGEAYFEVAHDRQHPFIVESEKQEVKVLGTSFNLSSYPDEAVVKTTLLEGSVSVQPSGPSDGAGVKLMPGESSILQSGKLKKQLAVTEIAVAWKNEKFMFDNEGINAIMRMVERWYDVEVEYVGDKPDDKFGGSVSRFDNVSKVLSILELTGNVHFRIEGRKIYVSK